MLNQIQQSDFKNQEAKEMCLSVAMCLHTFEDRRKGAHFRGIMLSIADVYTEDKALIYSFFRVMRPKSKKDTGKKPKFYPGGKNKSKPSSKNQNNCEDCPDVITNDVSVKTSMNKIKGTSDVAGRKNLKLGTPSQPKGAEAFTTIDEIMYRFEGNALAMKAYIQANNISANVNASKPETLARYILNHYQNPEENE